jgi:antitoxin ChpS
MIAIPPPLLELLRLRAGSKVDVAIEKGRLIVEPQKRPRYTLAELLSKSNPRAKRSREDREWLTGKATGRELI